MNLLLDSCTLIWLASEPARLSRTAVAAINAPDPAKRDATQPHRLTLARNCVRSSEVNTTDSVRRAQAHLPAVVRSARRGQRVGLTERDETVAYVVSRERMEGILETMELLATPAFLRALKAERAGRTKYFPADARLLTDE